MTDRAIADYGLLSDCHSAVAELDVTHGPTHVGLINAARALSVMASVIETP